MSKSRFVDFQKVRIQEIQSELPRGSIPRSLEIILRAETVERAQPGDRVDFVGKFPRFVFDRSASRGGPRSYYSSRRCRRKTELKICSKF